MNAADLLHRALEPAPGGPLEAADLRDEERLAVVLEAAALVALLRRAGGRIRGGASGVAVDGDGHLRVGEVVDGEGAAPPQRILREMLQAVFRTSGRIPGKGGVRRAAERLLARWAPVLVPFDPDRLVADVFDEAPFLWRSRFGAWRRSLVAETPDGGFWCAGPRGVELRLRSRVGDASAAGDLLAGRRARDLWENVDPERDDPSRLFAEGRWARAARLYRRLAPEDPESGLLRGRCLFGLGRYSAALQVIRGRTDPGAELVRVRAQIRLGRFDAARRTLGRLERLDGLSADQRIERAEAAVRIHSRRGRDEEAREWARRAVAGTRGRQRARALLLVAAAAIERGDLDEHERQLRAAEELRDDPDLGWHWERQAASLALARRDGQGALESLARVLGRRRRLSRELAGRLWSNVAFGRVLVDDLPGAERACRAALRLLVACEGPARESLALANLAEVRIRRGRLGGAVETIQDALAEDRRSGNLESLKWTWLLWVRMELARGRPLGALTRLREARDEVAGRGDRPWDDPEGKVLEARALGRLGDPQRARELLEQADPEALGELEPEERPAVWALAGAPEEALRVAQGSPWRPLWRAALAGEVVAADRWEELDRLEGYRRARLVADLEAVRPGSCPASRVREAIGTLRDAGAEALAEDLESRASRPWRALRRFLEISRPGPEAFRRLFGEAGLPEARLVLRRGPAQTVLLDARGGEAKLGAPVPGGRLEVSLSRADEVARTLLEAVRAVGDFDAGGGAESESAEDAADRLPLGEHPSFREQLDRLDRVAGSDLPILILGESGTGKELVARRAHEGSSRAAGPFVAVNCAAFTGSLLMSELFGHARGAFTGADQDRQGIFETAHGGTVFLDEVGEMSAEAQAAMLRVLEEKEIRRVGEQFHRAIDVRILSATHRDLEAMVEEGDFRFDLFHRLNVFRIELPTLRERGDDVLLLACYFQRRAGCTETLSSEVRAALRRHPWPGNVRELQNVMSVARVLAGDDPIGAEHLRLPEAEGGTVSESGGTYHAAVEQTKRQLVRRALRASGGNKAEAARRLDLSRQALSYLVRRLGLDDEDFGTS